MKDTVEHARTAAAHCADADPAHLPDTELIHTLEVLHQAEQLIRVAQAHVIAQIQARRIPSTVHASSTATWLRDRLRMDLYTAGTLVKQAHATTTRPVLDDALTTGVITAEQGSVIAAALRDLPEELQPAAVDKAEAILIDWAGRLEPRLLRKHATRILDHVAPHLATAVTTAELERQHQRARQSRTLKIYPIPYGRVRINGVLDAESAAVVTAALDPLCAPRPGRPRQYDQRRADALVEVCKLALRGRDLPSDGGERPQVTVTIPFDPLTQALGPGVLDTGEPLTPAQTRRLACDAQITPVVLGGQGQVLDVGRTRRLITGALHRALVARDRGCAFPGCDRPPRFCESHHIVAWHQGGPTSLANAVLLCGFHHRLMHHSTWQIRLAADEHPEFIPPRHLDPHQQPQRNLYHRRI